MILWFSSNLFFFVFSDSNEASIKILAVTVDFVSSNKRITPLNYKELRDDNISTELRKAYSSSSFSTACIPSIIFFLSLVCIFQSIPKVE
jgi:hypothetical protein